MQQKLALLGIALLVVLPVRSLALGLGDIYLKSALNQPLDAEIDLLSATTEELNSLEVSLASADTFSSYGIEYQRFLNDLRFAVSKRPDGTWFVRVRSNQPVREPFITFLVEADWARGRLLREYTVLVDPPIFIPAEAQPAAPVRPAQTGTRPSQRTGAVPPPAPPPRQAVQPPAPSARVSGDSYGPIQRAETLWEIANRVRPDESVSINQMMIALYEANPEAFIGNINLVKQGYVLRIPGYAEITSRSKSATLAQVRDHHARWGGATTTPGGQLRLVVPDESGAAIGAGRSAEELAAQRVENQALSDRVRELEDALQTAEQRIELQNEELADLQNQLRALQELEESLGVETVTTEPSVPGVDLEPDVTAPPQQPDVGAEPPPEVAEPVEAQPPVARRPEPSLMERVTTFLTQTWVLIGAGVLALLAIGAVFLRRRGEEDEDEPAWERFEPAAEETTAALATETIGVREDESMIVVERDPGDTITEEIIVPEADAAAESFDSLSMDSIESYQPLTEEHPAVEEDYPFEQTLADDTALKIQLDETDVMAEADFHMAYGLYDQAAGLMEKASAKEPHRHEYRMKLIEIYFIWGNKEKFLEKANEFHAQLGAEVNTSGEWDKVAIMGKQICPDEDLFTGAGALAGAAEAVDLDLAHSGEAVTKVDLVTEGTDNVVDMDFGAAITEAEREELAEPLGDTELDIDVDLGLDDLTADEGAAVDETTLDPGTHVQATDETGEAEALSEQSLDLDLNLESGFFKAEELARPETKSGRPDFVVDTEEGTRQMEAPDLDVFGDDEATAISPRPDIPLSDGDKTVIAEGLQIGADELTVKADVGDLGPGDAETVRADVVGLGDDLTVRADTAGAGVADDDLTVRSEHVARDETQIEPTLQSEQADVELIGDTEATSKNKALDTAATTRAESLDEETASITQKLSAGPPPDQIDEVSTKLDLARAFMDMGDPDGARSILKEVLTEGDETQRNEAQGLIDGMR